jgi:hypothetical protein
MATGIVAVAARLLGHDLLAWPLFAISLAAYPLWAILLARVVCFPRAVLADFVSHQRGPSFLTIVAANGVLGSQFAVFHTAIFLLPGLFWFSLLLWVVLISGFLSSVTRSHARLRDRGAFAIPRGDSACGVLGVAACLGIDLHRYGGAVAAGFPYAPEQAGTLLVL